MDAYDLNYSLYVPLPSPPIHPLSALAGDRTRLRVDAHRVSAHALRLGTGRHRRADYPEQE